MPTSLTNKEINLTYPGLIKTIDNAELGATPKQLTDGVGNPLNIAIAQDITLFDGTVDFTEADVIGLNLSGAQGFQGPIGPTGSNGIDGTQGLQGPFGLQGSTGPQGFSGNQGLQGPIGHQGPAGPQGLVGATGLQGAKGDMGFQGLAGAQGLQGPQGRQGIQGPTGLQGNVGVQGSQGLQGPIGSQGFQGTQGPSTTQNLNQTLLIGNTASSTILLTKGGLSSPSYSFSNDTDTGLTSLVSDGMHIITGGLNKVDFRPGGDVFSYYAGTPLAVQHLLRIATDTNRLYLQTSKDGTASSGAELQIGKYNSTIPLVRFNTETMQTSFNVGTGATPSITFIGDTNTGFFSAGADTIGITTNGTTKILISGTQSTFNTNVDLNAIVDFTDATVIGLNLPPGPQGAQGFQGPAGIDGTQGVQGLQGPIGSQGLNGTNGLQGDIGPQGYQGFQGPEGPTVGVQGLQGPQGDIGTTGLQGSTGPQGNTGLQGSQGFQGPQGRQGIQGPIGLQGTNGSNGLQGPQGLVGPQGFPGNNGTQGLQGPMGPEGAPGVGFQGPAGPQGRQGPQGPIGLQGNVGPVGSQGFQGRQGPAGPQGLVGNTGAQGFQGNIGNTGATGAQGFQGPIGLQGNVGNTGATGAQGFQGNIGNTGATGAQGFQGNVGNTGATGAQGFQGVPGPVNILNNANNRVITATGGTDLQAETNMTFDGSSLVVSGNISATGDITAFASSDERLKDDITKIEGALDIIEKISGYTFNWNDKQNIYSGKDYGVIAQEIKEVMPELVNERLNGYLAVRYDKIIPLLIEAIKELKNR